MSSGCITRPGTASCGAFQYLDGAGATSESTDTHPPAKQASAETAAIVNFSFIAKSPCYALPISPRAKNGILSKTLRWKASSHMYITGVM